MWCDIYIYIFIDKCYIYISYIYVCDIISIYIYCMIYYLYCLQVSSQKKHLWFQKHIIKIDRCEFPCQYLVRQNPEAKKNTKGRKCHQRGQRVWEDSDFDEEIRGKSLNHSAPTVETQHQEQTPTIPGPRMLACRLVTTRMT